MIALCTSCLGFLNLMEAPLFQFGSHKITVITCFVSVRYLVHRKLHKQPNSAVTGIIATDLVPVWLNPGGNKPENSAKQQSFALYSSEPSNAVLNPVGKLAPTVTAQVSNRICSYYRDSPVPHCCLQHYCFLYESDQPSVTL